MRGEVEPGKRPALQAITKKTNGRSEWCVQDVKTQQLVGEMKVVAQPSKEDANQQRAKHPYVHLRYHQHNIID